MDNCAKRKEINVDKRCSIIKKCGKCQNFDLPYQQQLKIKQKDIEKMMKKYCKMHFIEGMPEPYHYRSSIQAMFGHQKGVPIAGFYKSGSHVLIPVEDCLVEDQKARMVVESIRAMLKSFKIRIYDENSGDGFLRYVLIRRGVVTGQIMVVLVTASPMFPSKNNFVKALRQKHPEITTIVQNINERVVNTGLGNQEKILYGKGYIEDWLGGCTIRISSKSRFPVNPVQAEVLYEKVMAAAGLTGTEVVFDASCEGGILGMMASKAAKKVIAVEHNKEVVKTAIDNAKVNQRKNIQFYQNDAGQLMKQVADSGERVDVVIFDPAKLKNAKEFFDTLPVLKPKKVIYVADSLVSLDKDMLSLGQAGYKAAEAWMVDMLPWTGHCEIIIKMCRK